MSRLGSGVPGQNAIKTIEVLNNIRDKYSRVTLDALRKRRGGDGQTNRSALRGRATATLNVGPLLFNLKR